MLKPSIENISIIINKLKELKIAKEEFKKKRFSTPIQRGVFNAQNKPLSLYIWRLPEKVRREHFTNCNIPIRYPRSKYGRFIVFDDKELKLYSEDEKGIPKHKGVRVDLDEELLVIALKNKIKKERQQYWIDNIQPIIDEIDKLLFPFWDYFKAHGSWGGREQYRIETVVKSQKPADLDRVIREIEKVRYKIEVEAKQQTDRVGDGQEAVSVQGLVENRQYVKEHEDFLKQIARIVHDSIEDQNKRKEFQDQLSGLRNLTDNFADALKKAQEAAIADPKLRYNYDDVRDKDKPPPKPPVEGYELESHYVLETPPKGFWRPPLPFNPDGWLSRFQCQYAGLIHPPKEEPRNREQMLICEYALLAAIHDEALDIPACDRLTDREQDDWVEPLWDGVSDEGTTWEDIQALPDRQNYIEIALNDVKADLAKKQTEQENETNELDDKILDRARQCIKVRFEERRRVFPKEVNRVIQEVQNIADTAQCSGTFVRVHEICEQEIGTRIEIVFDCLLRIHEIHGSPINITQATNLKEEVGHYIESTVEEVREYMIQRLPMSKSDVHYFDFEHIKRLVKEKLDVKVDLYIDSLKSERVLQNLSDKRTETEKKKYRTKSSEKKYKPWTKPGDGCLVIVQIPKGDWTEGIHFYYDGKHKNLRLKKNSRIPKLFGWLAEGPVLSKQIESDICKKGTRATDIVGYANKLLNEKIIQLGFVGLPKDIQFVKHGEFTADYNCTLPIYSSLEEMELQNLKHLLVDDRGFKALDESEESFG